MTSAARNENDDAIGVFDSGVGGLTVVRQLAARLPNEHIVYLGDTARVPYGTKSAATVIRYARACAAMLIERQVKLIVVACNTASACAVPALRDELDVPVIGVVEPGAHAAAAKTKCGRIGILGTAATTASNAYPDRIAALRPDAKVIGRACPLFVPLAEEGWIDGDVPRLAAERYLGDLLDTGVDTLVLGCTHYPLLANVIAQTAGPAVTLVDSAEETAKAVEETLAGVGLHREENGSRHLHFLVSDDPDRFATVGERFLGHTLDSVEWVDF